LQDEIFTPLAFHTVQTGSWLPPTPFPMLTTYQSVPGIFRRLLDPWSWDQ